ncbi:MAG TPA: hypothetical protein DDZ22_07685, partial [Massilia sp.]|nr:hypothetical protein [Massilia sp.]
MPGDRGAGCGDLLFQRRQDLVQLALVERERRQGRHGTHALQGLRLSAPGGGEAVVLGRQLVQFGGQLVQPRAARPRLLHAPGLDPAQLRNLLPL